MSGPEEIPYTLLSKRADELSVQHGLDTYRTKYFLIDDLPEATLPHLKDAVYSRISTFAGNPDDPSHIRALEDIAWADAIDDLRTRHKLTLGAFGAVAGGASVVAAQTAYVSTAEDIASPGHAEYGLGEYMVQAGSLILPVLIGGAIGSAIAKEFTDRRLKWSSRHFVKETERLDGHGSPQPKGRLLGRYPVPRVKEFSKPQVSALHPERTEEISPYKTAQRWARSRGCDDETKYADFLAAEMPPSELTALI